MQSKKEKEIIEELISILFIPLYICLFFCSIGAGCFVIIWQCLRWLKDGVWQGMAVRDGLAWQYGTTMSHYSPDTGYLGVDKILTYILNDIPLSLFLLFIFPVILAAIFFVFLKPLRN